MGYNMSCGISGISIKEGMEVSFIPLQPVRYRQKKNVLSPRTKLIYPNDIFNPFTFPIKGKYNGYGSVEDIEENVFTEQLKARYGLTMEQIIQAISCDRKLTDPNGYVHEYYAITRRPNTLEEVGFQKGERYGYEGFENPRLPEYFVLARMEPVTKNQTLPLGVSIAELEFQQAKDHFSIIKDGILVEMGSSAFFAKEVLNSMAELTGIYLNYKPEDQIKIQELSQMSGMVILEEIYQFAISKHDGFSDYTWNEIQEDVANDKKKIEEGLITHADLKARFSAGENIDVFEVSGSYPFSSFNMGEYYSLDQVRRWNYKVFRELLLPVFENNTEEFFTEVLNFNILYTTMMAMGKHFTPALSGKEMGNYAIKALAEKTLSVVERLTSEED